MDQHLTYESELDRQKALMVIDDLIQRTESAANRLLYQKQRERILNASIGDAPTQPLPPMMPGPYPGP